MIFENIADFKKYVGGGANVSVEIESIEPTMADAFRLHIEQWLGSAQWEALLNAIENNTATTAELALIQKIKEPLAKLTMYEYSKIGGLQFTESGMHRMENDNAKSAYKYQEREYANYMLEHGYESIESLLKFLDLHEADYPLWFNADAYTLHNAYFVRYASELRMHYSKYITRYAYETLRPVIEDVECVAVEAIMSEGLYDYLKTKYNTGTANSQEKRSIFLIQRIIVNFAVMEGLQRNWLQIEGRRIVHATTEENQGRTTLSTANQQAVSFAHRHHELMANRYVHKFLRFIVENEADFPLAFCGTDEFDGADSIPFATNYAWAGNSSTNPRCFATAAQLEAAKAESDCCGDTKCPERDHACACGSFSTEPCGCGCASGGGKVFRL